MSLIFSSLITAFISSDTGDTFVYIINILITGAFLYFSFGEMLAVTLPSFLILLYTIIEKQHNTLIREENMINIYAVTLFAIAIAYLNFKAQLTRFQYEQIIKKKNEELKYLSEMDGLTNIANRRKIWA